MAFLPRADSWAASISLWKGRTTWARSEMRRLSFVMVTPWPRSSLISSTRPMGSSTTPLPMTQSLSDHRMPEGTRWRIYFFPLAITVWPALLPPWPRATTSADSVRKSIILPLPSSPHWEPIIMVFMIKMELGDLNEIPALWQDNLTELLSFPDQWREARQGRREGPCRIIRFQERRDRGIGRAVPRGRKGRPAEKELSGSGGRNGALPPEPAFSRCLHPQRSCAGCPAACGAAGIH